MYLISNRFTTIDSRGHLPCMIETVESTCHVWQKQCANNILVIKLDRKLFGHSIKIYSSWIWKLRYRTGHEFLSTIHWNSWVKFIKRSCLCHVIYISCSQLNDRMSNLEIHQFQEQGDILTCTLMERKFKHAAHVHSLATSKQSMFTLFFFHKKSYIIGEGCMEMDIPCAKAQPMGGFFFWKVREFSWGSGKFALAEVNQGTVQNLWPGGVEVLTCTAGQKLVPHP